MTNYYTECLGCGELIPVTIKEVDEIEQEKWHPYCYKCDPHI